MAKVKKCLDSNCTHYIFLDDGRVVHQPKAKCDRKRLPEDFTEELETLTSQVDKTVYVSIGAFDRCKIVEGEELKF